MPQRIRTRPVRLLAGALILVAAFAAGAATTVISAPESPTYYGCIARAGGSLYGVSTSPTYCRYGDTQISWNQEGLQGEPGLRGDTGPAGPGFGGIRLERVVQEIVADTSVFVRADCESDELYLDGGYVVLTDASGDHIYDRTGVHVSMAGAGSIEFNDSRIVNGYHLLIRNDLPDSIWVNVDAYCASITGGGSTTTLGAPQGPLSGEDEATGRRPLDP